MTTENKLKELLNLTEFTDLQDLTKKIVKGTPQVLTNENLFKGISQTIIHMDTIHRYKSQINPCTCSDKDYRDIDFLNNLSGQTYSVIFCRNCGRSSGVYEIRLAENMVNDWNRLVKPSLFKRFIDVLNPFS